MPAGVASESVFTLAFTFLYGSARMLNGALVDASHLTAPPVGFLYSGWGVVLAELTVYTPFVLRPLLAAFSLVDQAQIKVAGILGARPWRVVTHVSTRLGHLGGAGAPASGGALAPRAGAPVFVPSAVPSVSVGCGLLVAFSRPPVLLNGTIAIVIVAHDVLISAFTFGNVSAGLPPRSGL